MNWRQRRRIKRGIKRAIKMSHPVANEAMRRLVNGERVDLGDLRREMDG